MGRPNRFLLHTLMIDGIHTPGGAELYGTPWLNNASKGNQVGDSLESSARSDSVDGANSRGDSSPRAISANQKPGESNTGSGQDGSERDGDQDKNELTTEEQEQVRKLQARDAEVRAHEAAHQAAAGGLATGGPSYQYQRGPDGKNYAVGGHVSINTSKGRTPEETLQRAQQIRAAALAPASPSGQDMKVAAAAGSMEMEAQRELQEKRQTEMESLSGNSGNESAGASKAFEGWEVVINPMEGKSAENSGEDPNARRSAEAKDSDEAKVSANESQHSFNLAHLKQCPDCMQKFYKNQGNDVSENAVFA